MLALIPNPTTRRRFCGMPASPLARHCKEPFPGAEDLPVQSAPQAALPVPHRPQSVCHSAFGARYDAVWSSLVWSGAVRCGAVRSGLVWCGAVRRGAVRSGLPCSVVRVVWGVSGRLQVGPDEPYVAPMLQRRGLRGQHLAHGAWVQCLSFTSQPRAIASNDPQPSRVS